MNTKNLNLEATKIEGILNNLDGCTCEKTGNTSQENFKILRKSDGAETIIAVYHKTGGKTSLVVSGSPKYKPFGEELTALIVEKTETISLSQINDVIVVIAEDFAKFLEELDSADKITEKALNGGTEYLFKGEHKEKFVLNYYNKSRKLQLIGAPLPFSMKVLAVLDGLGYSATKRVIEKGTEVTFDSSDLWNRYMPKSKQALPETLRNIVEPSMIYMQVTIPLPDYASHLHPVLRGMESSMRRVLEDHDIEVHPEKFDVFSKFKGKTIVDIKYNDKIDDIKREKVVNCYNFYNTHRHSLFHASEDALEVRCIDTREEALELLFKSFELMEVLNE
ncbi:MAG: hypothetical protein GQ474_02950 [Sulfurimonas sp.]|nr:hypothetical protein [Sulfurimonas sp.]